MLFFVRFENIILIGTLSLPVKGPYVALIALERSYPYLAALARILDLCLCDLMWWTAPQWYPAGHQAIESRILKSRLQFLGDILTFCKKLYIIVSTMSRLCWRWMQGVSCICEQVSRGCILVIVACFFATNSIGCISVSSWRISSYRKFTT